jgi:UDP:flavonoid glycosyltransferase YjiC (YdhE family)
MGHYARVYAIAMAMKRRDPTMEIVFFTTNYVLHPLYSEGMTAYHLPNRQKFDGMDAKTWNLQCEEMLANVFSVHRPSIFIFDGAYPYRGMLNAIKTRRGVKRIWIRRVTRKGRDSAPADSFRHFDRIVVPGDIIEPNMEELAKWPVEEINLTSPLLSVSRNDLHPRGELRASLGIPNESTVCLVSLGAGDINDISNLRDFVVEGLIERGVFVIIADSMLKPMKERYEDEKIRVVQRFPLMRSRNCLDFAIIAGGYNSVNECLLLRLPSVIIPNFQTSRDDQPGRATRAAETGGAIVVEDVDRGLIQLALDRICDSDVRSEMAQRLVMSFSDDGADSLAESLISNLDKP